MRRWHKVTDAELRRLWTAQRRRGVCFNGCTHAALTQRYGSANLQHRPGFGWYKLTRQGAA